MTNFRMAFRQEIANRLEYMETYLPSPVRSPVANLAMSEPSTLKLKDGYVVLKADDVHVTRFFLVGLTANSSLFAGAAARGLSVIFSGRTLPRAMAVLGQMFIRKKFIVSTFARGISLSTYKRNQNTPSASSSSPTKLKVAPRSPSKRGPTSKNMSTWDGVHGMSKLPNIHTISPSCKHPLS
jgi:hypothetical protein